jgi:hypothetical protein
MRLGSKERLQSTWTRVVLSSSETVFVEFCDFITFSMHQ